MPKGQSIWFIAAYQGTAPIFSIDPATKAVTTVNDEFGDYSSLAPVGNDVVIATRHSMLRPDELLVMVGKMTPEQKAALPESVLRIDRTDNVQQLAALYSTAVALVNPTWQDNYPTVNLEAISCGTPVVTYRTGGSIESVTPGTGFVVEQGDVKAMLECVRKETPF